MIFPSAKQALLFFIGGLLAAFVFLPASSTQAANSSDPCDLNAKLDVLSQAKSELEFTARQDLLSATINCSLEESDDIKNKISKLNSLSDAADRRAAAAYDNLLESFIGYYADQKTEFVSASTSPDQIKDLAQQILSWRESHYNQPIRQIADFTLALKQQDGVSVAASRLKKIRSSLTSLLSIRNQEINRLLSDADKNISRSRELNEQALSALRSSFLASPAATAYTATTTPSGADSFSISTTTPLYFISILPNNTSAQTSTPRDLIRDSYENLKTAYENFFQINKAVRKILGF